MFGRGNWAIAGLVKESLEGFTANLADPARMAVASQLAAGAVARLYGSDATGVNPYSAPRLDEEQELTVDQQTELARHAIADQEEGTTAALAEEILAGTGYGRGVEAFQIHGELPWFGLWAVSNEWKNASDLPSIKEQRSYVMLERPYKFCSPPINGPWTIRRTTPRRFPARRFRCCWISSRGASISRARTRSRFTR